MSDTPHLGLPLLEAAQAQKHVIVNEALARLDALVQLSVLSRSLAAPPASPAEADRYLVAAGATGVWGGHAGQIAIWLAGSWDYAIPQEGWSLWVADEDAALRFDGTSWAAGGVPSSLQNMQFVGINATADATNKLVVASSASLFNHAGNGHQIKLNKNAGTDTASLLWQTAFSGRAELGTSGNDDLQVKVSPDGTNWQTGLSIDRTSGVVSLPQGLGALPVFSAAAKGLVPAAGSGTTEFLRADGAWSPAPIGLANIAYRSDPGRWLVNSANATTLTAAAGAANRLDLAPWISPLDMLADQIAVLCSTAVAGAQGKIVCYASDGNGRPGTLLFETTVLDFATTGLKSAAINQAFARGVLYWLGLRTSSTAAVSAHQPYCSPVIAYPPTPTTSAPKLLRRTLAFATPAPATWGWTAAEEFAAVVPAIFIEFA